MHRNHTLRGAIPISLLAIALALGFTILGTARATQAVPEGDLGTAFVYQGRLDRDGRPVNGSCDLAFRLYAQETGGTSVAPAVTSTLTVYQGLFTAQPDFGPGAFDGGERWLEVMARCPGDTSFTVLPRQPLQASPYALYALGVAWTGLSDVPPDFADGVDDDTTYLAGQGLSLQGPAFSVDSRTVQERVNGTCPPGSAIREIGQDGSVGCDLTNDGDITEIVAGTGLLGGGAGGAVALEANTAYLQRRVEGVCLGEQAIRLVNANGSVVCEADDDTRYQAGNQLYLEDRTFHVQEGSGSDLDADMLDLRHGAYLLNASSVNSGTLGTNYYSAYADLGAEFFLTNAYGDVAQNNGSPQTSLNADLLSGMHATDFLNASNINDGPLGTDFFSAYGDLLVEGKVGTPGGIAVNDTTLQPSLNASKLGGLASTAYQKRVEGLCAASHAIQTVNANGTITCTAVSGGSVTALYTEAGVTGGQDSGDVVLAADTDYLQRRVGACTGENWIRAVNAQGNVTCETDDDTGGDVNSVSATSGLSGGGNTGALTISADFSLAQAKVRQTCTTGGIQQIEADGDVVCEPDNSNTYSAGFGITKTGNQLSAKYSEVQKRLSTPCEAGKALNNISEAGVPTCVTIPAGTVTGVDARYGLQGGGTSGDLYIATSFDKVYPTSRVSHCDEQDLTPDPVIMWSKQRSFCYLYWIEMADIKHSGSDNRSGCKVDTNTTDWYIQAWCAGDSSNSDYVYCRAKCLIWP